MNSRERIMTTLNHSEPDKLPIDLGDYVTGIHIIVYQTKEEIIAEIEDSKKYFK